MKVTEQYFSGPDSCPDWDHFVPRLIRGSNPDFRMSAGSLPKCCGFITLSASVISPSVVKIGRRKSPKKSSIPQWWGKWKSDQESISGTGSSVLPISRPNHNTKFQWNRQLLGLLLQQSCMLTGRITDDRQTVRYRSHYFVFYTHCFLVCLLHYVCNFIYTCVLSPVLLVLALSRS